jgi:diguanylate cyclase (GGDEF)-like protein
MTTILVIEDDEIIRSNLLEILELEGFRAISAESGRHGIQQAKDCLPDLILCDIQMPELDGYEVLEALRSTPETVGIPVIFLTAKTAHQDFRRGMNLGADDYLTKPCSVGELLSSISTRLKRQATLNHLTHQYAPLPTSQPTEELKPETFFDPLTSLPTRLLLYQQLSRTLAHRASDVIVSVLCVNIHRFHTINASFGHSAGDAVLQNVAERLNQVMRSTLDKMAQHPQGMVARLHGDQFALFLTDLMEVEVANLAQHLLEAVTAPYVIDDREIRVQVSIGITCTTQSDCTPQALLTQAETAQHWCQPLGMSGYRFYSASLDALEVERRLIEMDLGKAIEQSEFQVYYQPQVDLKTGRIVGMESLLRWSHPTRGPISPGTFIPIAEELGLIVPLGEWVLRTACSHAKRWQALSLEPLRVSVNLSMRQLQQEDLLDRVATILDETGLDPSLLSLELTETSIMSDLTMAIATLENLRKLGIEISIDDFGTGYSSLRSLNQLPIDSLKIDHTFVKQLNAAKGAEILTTIIEMAKNLDLHVVAEGIETPNQLAFFRDRGCHAMQGYLYSPPIPVDEVHILLSLDRRLQMASA